MRLLLLTIVLGMLAGCNAVHMARPESLRDTASYDVEGRQGWKIKEQISFGPFETTAVERSWAKGRSLSVTPVEIDRQRQTYDFILLEQATERWRVSCATSLQRDAVDVGVADVELANRSTLVCTFLPTVDGAAVWQMNLAEENERPLSGRLTDGTTTYEIVGTKRTESGLPADTPTGYWFETGAQAVAAVEVINDGLVHLPESDAARPLLAAASTALFLVEDLRGYLAED